MIRKKNAKVKDLIERIKKLVDSKQKKLNSQGYRLISRNWKIWLDILRKGNRSPYLVDAVDFVGYMTRSKKFPKYIPYLEKYLSHPSEDMRSHAVSALGVYADDKHFPKFLAMLKTDGKIRWQICMDLSNFSDRFEEEIIDALIWAIKRQEYLSQWTALYGLVRWINPRVPETLAWASKHAKWIECRKLARKLLKG